MKVLFLALCAAALFHPSFAQNTPVPNSINTPATNRVIMTHRPGEPPFFSEQPGDFSGKDEFTIIMKDDSAFAARTKINHSEQKHSVTVKGTANKKKIIYPADTKGLIRIDETGNELYGIPTDSCWLFQTASGRINSFSFLAEPGMENIIAIQYGDDGLIVPLTKRNLFRIVGNEPRLVKLIEKGRLIKAITMFNKEDHRELWK